MNWTEDQWLTLLRSYQHDHGKALESLRGCERDLSEANSTVQTCFGQLAQVPATRPEYEAGKLAGAGVSGALLASLLWYALTRRRPRSAA